MPNSSTLKAILRTASPEALESISEFWGFKSDNGDGAVSPDFLYPRMQSAQYFRAAFDRLQPQERDTLTFLAMHGGQLPQQEIAERMFAGDEGAAAAVIESLQGKGFVFYSTVGKDNFVCVPSAYLQHHELPPHLMGFLGRLLTELPEEDLQVIAQNVLDKDYKAALKNGTILHSIRAKLLQPEVLHDYINALPDVELEIFTLLLKRHGSCLYRDLLDFASQRKFDHAKAEQLNSLLANRGVAFALMQGHNKYSNLLVIPRDILYIVENGYQPDKRSLAELDLVAASSESIDPRFIVNNTYALLRDLMIIASFLTSQSVKRLSTGGINRNDLKKILPFLAGPKNTKYAMFLSAFLLGKKHLVEMGPYWKSADSFNKLIRNSAQTYKEFYNWWLAQGEWDEGLLEGVSFSSARPASSIVKLVEVRRIILHAVAALPQDKWVSFTTFYETILPQVESTFPKFAGATGRTIRTHPLKATIKNILEESLNWLGVLMIGYEKQPRMAEQTPSAVARKGNAPPLKAAMPRDDAEFAFKPTPLGVALFKTGLLEDVFPNNDEVDNLLPRHESGDFFVQPNLAVIAPPDLALDKLLFLTQFSVVRNVDVMTTLEITRDSMRGALDRGAHGDEVYQFLMESCRIALPETVKHLIDDCAAQHGQARIALAGGIITSDQQYVLEEIKRSSRMQPYIREVIDDRAIILAQNVDLTKVTRELRAMGLMPELESETVQETKDERYHLTLTAEELYELIATTRLVAQIEEQFSADISRGQASALAQKLKPEGARFRAMHEHTESAAKAYEKRFQAALDKVIEDVEGKYKDQVAKLVTRSISGRGPSKYNFKGPNPAVEREDVQKLLTFANEYELETEILYIRQNDQEARILITPKSFEGKRLYAHCSDTDSDSIYSMDRILRARLL